MLKKAKCLLKADILNKLGKHKVNVEHNRVKYNKIENSTSAKT